MPHTTQRCTHEIKRSIMILRLVVICAMLFYTPENARILSTLRRVMFLLCERQKMAYHHRAHKDRMNKATFPHCLTLIFSWKPSQLPHTFAKTKQPTLVAANVSFQQSFHWTSKSARRLAFNLTVQHTSPVQFHIHLYISMVVFVQSVHTENYCPTDTIIIRSIA